MKNYEIGEEITKFFNSLINLDPYDNYRNINFENNPDYAEIFNNIRSFFEKGCKWELYKLDIYIAVESFSIQYKLREVKITSLQFNDFYESMIIQYTNLFFDQVKNILRNQQQKRSAIGLQNFILNKCLKLISIKQENVEIEYISKQLITNKTTIEDMNKTLENSVKNLNKKLKKTDEKIEEQSKAISDSSITILGIFVGIVMVFFGGFSILDNAIETLSKVSAYRLYFTMIVFGAIMYNIVILLFFLIGRITNKHITCTCHQTIKETETSRNRCFNCTEHKFNKGVCRIKNTLPYVYWGNLFIFSALLFLFGMKFFAKQDDPLILDKWQFVKSIIAPIVLLFFSYIPFRTKTPKSKKNSP